MLLLHDPVIENVHLLPVPFQPLLVLNQDFLRYRYLLDFRQQILLPIDHFYQLLNCQVTPLA